MNETFRVVEKGPLGSKDCVNVFEAEQVPEAQTAPDWIDSVALKPFALEGRVPFRLVDPVPIQVPVPFAPEIGCPSCCHAHMASDEPSPLHASVQEYVAEEADAEKADPTSIAIATTATETPIRFV